MRPSDGIQHFIALWLCGAIITVIGLAVLTGAGLKDHGWWGYLRLVKAGATTEAVVTRTDRSNHCLVEYSFAVDGQSYSGSGGDCSVRVGQGVTVTYLRSDPQLSSLGLASDALQNELTTFLLAGVIIPPFALFVVSRWRRAVRGKINRCLTTRSSRPRTSLEKVDTSS